MPCYDPGPSEEEIREKFYAEFQHNSQVAEWLCFAMQIMWGRGVIGEMPKEAKEWWDEHQKRDQTANPERR